MLQADETLFYRSLHWLPGATLTGEFRIDEQLELLEAQGAADLLLEKRLTSVCFVLDYAGRSGSRSLPS